MTLWLWSVFLGFERRMIEKLLSSPTFHHGVRRVHRKVEDLRHGRNPDEPLAPGEATEDPNKTSFLTSFLGHFIDEVKNQIKGTPRDPRGPLPPMK